MDKVIGVLGYDNTRSQMDKMYLSNFSCDRRPQATLVMPKDVSGVLGNVNEGRSVRDMQMLQGYSCATTENYRSDSKIVYMMEPRSEKDKVMLKEFNSGVCKEGFLQRGSHMGQSAKIQYMQNGGPFENYQCPYAQLNYNPYNSSSNVKFVPMQ